MGLVAQCLYLCTCLAFSLMAARWLVQLLPSHPCSRQEEGERRKDYQLHLSCFMRKQKLSQKFPQQICTYTQWARQNRPSEPPIPSMEMEKVCIWLSDLYRREQQRWMIFRMAFRLLIYSVSCKRTMSQENGKVRSGRQLERWVAARVQRIIKVYIVRSHFWANANGWEPFASWLPSVPYLPHLPSLPLWKPQTVEHPQGEEGRSGCHSPTHAEDMGWRNGADNSD